MDTVGGGPPARRKEKTRLEKEDGNMDTNLTEGLQWNRVFGTGGQK